MAKEHDYQPWQPEHYYKERDVVRWTDGGLLRCTQSHKSPVVATLVNLLPRCWKPLQPVYTKMDAHFSPCKKYRYQLWRTWNPALPRVCFIMLNPSTADAEKDDPTIAKCARFAAAWGFGSLEILNIFAWRATDPAELKRRIKSGEDIIGPENNPIIETRMMADTINKVVGAWGNNGLLLERGDNMMRRIASVGRDLYALKVSQSTGQPYHPLYLNETIQPQMFKAGMRAAR